MLPQIASLRRQSTCQGLIAKLTEHLQQWAENSFYFMRMATIDTTLAFMNDQ